MLEAKIKNVERFFIASFLSFTAAAVLAVVQKRLRN